MLMRLQEAASYSSPQSNDSDSTSLDSHSSSIQDNNTKTESSTPSSTSNTTKAAPIKSTENKNTNCV